jgi:hypothetical protein
MSLPRLYPLLVLVVLGLGTAGPGAEPLLQDSGPDGIVCVEAEHFDENTPRPPHTWDLITTTFGFTGTFSGGQAMQSTPITPAGGAGINTGYAANSPRLDYNVYFSKTGTHYVWVLAWGLDGNSDSLHSGLDGEEIATADRIGGLNTTLHWTNTAYQDPERIMFEVKTPGLHTLNIYMREDGAVVDKILLTSNPSYTPTGFGPPESAREAPTKANSPKPADGATGITTPLFEWNKGVTAVFHNVYMGTSPDLTEADLVANRQPFAMYFHMQPLVPGTTYYWRVDEIEPDMTTVHTGTVWHFTVTPYEAWQSNPADGATGLFPAPTLRWNAGQQAVKHQVYLSNQAAEVENASAAAAQGEVATASFNAPILRSSTTYYWRVDEVKADGTSTPGPVWSFSTQDGAANKVVRQWWNGITGTAVTDLTGKPDYPDNPTGSELLDTFEGPTDAADNYGSRLYGWLKPPADGDYTFWMASDDYGELRLSTDADPANAAAIATVPGWTNAQEWTKYPAQKSAPITLKAGQKYYIQAVMKEGTSGDNIAVSWQGGPIAGQTIIAGQYVDTFALPPLQAFGPTPANGMVDAPQTGSLSWSAGDKAQKHDVYLGQDADAVAAADTSSPLYQGSQADASFNAGDLEWGQTYYWRVDEVNPAEPDSPWAGALWSFTTANFLPIEDFESYTDDEGNRIYESWIDGWTNSTGSQVGNLVAPFAEHTIVHGGAQSMPLDYNNVNTPFYSEAEYAFAPQQNWTANAVNTLSLWVRGNPVRFVDKGDGAFTVGASGHDIWDNADDFRFVYKRLNGNGSITVKVESLVNTNVWAKAGVMVRDSLNAGSMMAYMIQSFSSGASFGWRQSADGTCGSATQTGITAPQWVKLTRTGSAFTAQYSADGMTWTDITDATTGQIVSTTVPMGSSVYIGLCVTSHDTAATTSAEFSGAATTGGVSGAWQTAWIGDDPDLTNAPADLYVAVEDSAGKVAVSSDPALVNAAAWTQWQIPLSDFAGVNLARVRTLYLGVGDRDNPTAGGSGKIFVDDIRVVKQ